MAKKLSRKEFEQKILKLEEQRIFYTGGSNQDPKKDKALREEILELMAPIIKAKRAKLEKIGLKIIAKVTADHALLTLSTNSGTKIVNKYHESTWRFSHSTFKKSKRFPGAVRKELFEKMGEQLFKGSSLTRSASLFDVHVEFRHVGHGFERPWFFNALMTEAITKGFADEAFSSAHTKIRASLEKNKDIFKSKHQKAVEEEGQRQFYELMVKLTGSHYKMNEDELHNMVDEFRTKRLLEV